MDAVETERKRCVAIVETVMLEAPPAAQPALIRVLNLIASGAEPITFREQVEEGLEELRPPGAK